MHQSKDINERCDQREENGHNEDGVGQLEPVEEVYSDLEKD